MNILSVNIPPGRQTRPARIIAENETGKIEIVYFRAKSEYLKSIYKVGERITISGKVDIFNHKKQITHPDYVVSFNKKDTIPELEPIYPLSAGLKQNILRKSSLSILSKMPQLPEWIDEGLINSKNWPDFNREDLIEALNEFKSRKRRYGSLETKENTNRNQVI